GEESERFLTAGADASVLELRDGTWRLAHDKLREGVLRTLTPEELPALRRAVAEAIQAVHPADAAYYETLMGHWREVGDTERELHYLLPVVDILVRFRAAFGQAETLIARGLSLLSEHDIRRATLLNQGSENKSRQGDYITAQEQAQRAYILAEQ